MEGNADLADEGIALRRRLRRVAVIVVLVVILGTAIQALGRGMLESSASWAAVFIIFVGVLLWVAARFDIRPLLVARVSLYAVSALILALVAARGGIDGYYAPILALLPAFSIMVLGSRDTIVYGAFLLLATVGVFLGDSLLPVSSVPDDTRLGATTSVILTVLGANTAVLLTLVRESEGRHRRLRAVLAEQVHAATHDALTGLENRASVTARLAEIERRGDPVQLALIDLDGFKAVNDRHGHATGDRLLVAVATRMRDRLPRAILVARLGGDEFLVVHREEDDPGDMAARLNAPPRLGPEATPVTFSIGSARFPADATRTSLALSCADRALYAAKQAGKARHERYEGTAGGPLVRRP